MTEPLHTYDAYYNNRHDEVKAPSLYAAKQAAIGLFKPAKSKQHMVTVVLKQKADGTDVPLMSSNADFG